MRFRQIGLRFEPRNLWIGVYWTRRNEAWLKVTTIHLCVLPVFPIIIEAFKGSPQNPGTE